MTDAPVPAVDTLTRPEMERYARHLLIPGFGVPAQRSLKNARVLVLGAGGLGSPVLLYLAAAGVGTIGVVDDDRVTSSNLQRQVMHDTASVGMLKTESAAARLRALNPFVAVVEHAVRFDATNARELVAGYDIVVDGTDNFATRYLANDACVLEHRPYVWASVLRFHAQLSVFLADTGPCYRCVFPSPPPPGAVPSCAEAGVLGSLCGAVGAAQATETVKLLTGVGRPLIGRLGVYDALAGTWSYLTVAKNPACALCGPVSTITEVGAFVPDTCQTEGLAMTEPTRAGADGPTRLPHPLTAADMAERTVTVQQLQSMLDEREQGLRDFTLVDVREPAERDINHIPGSVLLPMHLFETGEAFAHLPEDREVLLYCKAGVRSERCLRQTLATGREAQHVAGGVSAWVTEIDPSQPSY